MRRVYAVAIALVSCGAISKAWPQAPAPFAFADFSWVPGNAGSSERPLTVGPFTGEFRMDTAYHYSFEQPIDDTISGSSEVFRHGEVQVTQIGIGGDVFYKNVMGRLMTQFGMYSQGTPRPGVGPHGLGARSRPGRESPDAGDVGEAVVREGRWLGIRGGIEPLSAASAPPASRPTAAARAGRSVASRS